MITDKSRRHFLRNMGLLFACAKFSIPLACAQTTEALKPLVANLSNFHAVYGKQSLKSEFILFLTNVFHLYPEQKLHALIETLVKQYSNDKEIYQALQPRLSEIAPVLKDLTYSVPALAKQKQVMTAQTLDLLGDRQQFARYLEVGSTGRYLDGLEEKLMIGDERYFMAEHEHSYSPADMVDRGQITKAGDFISLADYSPAIASKIVPNSLDLVCVYIGFHHCPIVLRNQFIGSIRDSMKMGAGLIVRDHNVNSTDMWHMVALAHDVFNMGTLETPDYNERELRNFYSLDYLAQLMVENGFKTDGRRIYQAGDPTHNALMLFTKV